MKTILNYVSMSMFVYGVIVYNTVYILQICLRPQFTIFDNLHTFYLFFPDMEIMNYLLYITWDAS